MEAQPTSTIDFISSLHGKQRRRERDLSKRDLQAAVKHGIKEPNIKGRWKYTFAEMHVPRLCAWRKKGQSHSVGEQPRIHEFAMNMP